MVQFVVDPMHIAYFLKKAHKMLKTLAALLLFLIFLLLTWPGFGVRSGSDRHENRKSDPNPDGQKHDADPNAA